MGKLGKQYGRTRKSLENPPICLKTLGLGGGGEGGGRGGGGRGGGGGGKKLGTIG